MLTCFKNLESCSFAANEKPRNAFVLMPFEEKMKNIYTHGIKEALIEIDWICSRADEKFDTPEVICTICKNIQEASLVIADLTGRNPNVFLEVGLAFGLGKRVVFLSQEFENIPFDAKTIRTILYDVNNIQTLKRDIQSLIKNIKPMMATANQSSFDRKCAERSKIIGTPPEPLMEIFIGATDETIEWLQSSESKNLDILRAIPDIFSVEHVIARRGYFEFKTYSPDFFARVDSDGFFHVVTPLKYNSEIYVSLMVQEIVQALFFMVRVLRSKERKAEQTLQIDFHGIRGLRVFPFPRSIGIREWSFSGQQDSLSYKELFNPQSSLSFFFDLTCRIYKDIYVDLGVTNVSDADMRLNTKTIIQQMQSLRTTYTSSGMQALPLNEILSEKQ